MTDRFCKDCKHVEFVYRVNVSLSGPACMRPVLSKGPYSEFVNLGNRIESERKKAWFFRKDRCGPEGKYFEPIEALERQS